MLFKDILATGQETLNNFFYNMFITIEEAGGHSWKYYLYAKLLIYCEHVTLLMLMPGQGGKVTKFALEATESAPAPLRQQQ